MKKTILLFVLLGLSFGVRAQEKEIVSLVPEQRKNDIMISPFPTILTAYINLSYERLLSADSGLGLDAIVGINKEVKATQFSPFYRMYFGKKYAGGFFVEGFVPITTTQYKELDLRYGTISYKEPENVTSIGLGVGFGGKWVTRKHIVFEASVGVAKRFGNQNKMTTPVTTKGLLGIGYRF